MGISLFHGLMFESVLNRYAIGINVDYIKEYVTSMLVNLGNLSILLTTQMNTITGVTASQR